MFQENSYFILFNGNEVILEKLLLRKQWRVERRHTELHMVKLEAVLIPV